ncbi:MAG: hypothetical protein AAF078_01445, partial [Planctomycetota bacterium]
MFHVHRVAMYALAMHNLEGMLSRIEIDAPALNRLSDATSLALSDFDLAGPYEQDLVDGVLWLRYPRWGTVVTEFSALQQAVGMANMQEFLGARLDGEEPREWTLEELLAEEWELGLWSDLAGVAQDTYDAWVPGHAQLTAVTEARVMLEVLAEYRATPAAGMADFTRRDGEGTVAAIYAAARATVNVRAELQVTHAAMRVEAYRLEHGDWPTDLAAVFGEVPQD